MACVTRNGNPNGAFWDRGQHWGRDENGGEDEGGNSRSTRSSLPQHSNPPTIPTNPPPAPPDKRSARTKKMDAQLDACNGVVIPSTLAVGEQPWIIPSQARRGAVLPFPCPICDSNYGRKDHVKSHFPSCVKRNGNPYGFCWDDLIE